MKLKITQLPFRLLALLTVWKQLESCEISISISKGTFSKENIHSLAAEANIEFLPYSLRNSSLSKVKDIKSISRRFCYLSPLNILWTSNSATGLFRLNQIRIHNLLVSSSDVQINCNLQVITTKSSISIAFLRNTCFPPNSSNVNAQGAKALIQVGPDVLWDKKINSSLDVPATLDLSTLEGEIPRSPYRVTGSRLLFIWAILEKNLNFSSTLLQFQENAFSSSPLNQTERRKTLISKYPALSLCVHCPLPKEGEGEGHPVIAFTLQSEFTFVYCRNSFEIGNVQLLDVFKKSFDMMGWLVLAAFSVFFGVVYRDPWHALDFWMSVIGYAFQRKWCSCLKISFLSLIVLNFAFSGMLTLDSVSPLPPSRISSMGQFLKMGFKLYALSQAMAQDLIKEFPKQFAKLGISEESTYEQLSRIFDISPPNSAWDWAPYCVALAATSPQRPRIRAAKVGARYASQNLAGVEYQMNGTAQCDTLLEPFASSWYTFWFRGHYTQRAYFLTLRLLQGGIHNFWEDLYFSGGERYVNKLKGEMQKKGIETAEAFVKKLSTVWKFYRIVQLHFIICGIHCFLFCLEICFHCLLKRRRNDAL